MVGGAGRGGHREREAGGWGRIRRGSDVRLSSEGQWRVSRRRGLGWEWQRREGALLVREQHVQSGEDRAQPSTGGAEG